MVWMVMVLVVAVLLVKVVVVRRRLPGERTRERLGPGGLPGMPRGIPLFGMRTHDRAPDHASAPPDVVHRPAPVTEESLKRAYTDGRMSVEQFEAALDRLYSGGEASGADDS